MAADLDTVNGTLEGIKQVLDAILLVLSELKTLSKNQANESAAVTATVETPKSSSAKAEGGGKAKESGPGVFSRGALTASEIARDLASPYSSRAEVGLSTLESGAGGLGAAIGGYFGGSIGAKIGKTLGDTGSAALLGESKFQLDATKRDLNGYLSGLAGYGIVATPEQAREARDFFAQQASLQSQALKVGAEALDATYLKDLLTGTAANAGALSDKDSQNLEAIKDVVSRAGNSEFGVGGRQ